MTLMDGLELYICVILTIEFFYDYHYNTVEQRIKRRKKLEKVKKEVDKQGFREGKSTTLPETAGEMRYVPKTSESIQTKIEPRSQP
jgi:hypothetical protein